MVDFEDTGIHLRFNKKHKSYLDLAKYLVFRAACALTTKRWNESKSLYAQPACDALVDAVNSNETHIFFHWCNQEWMLDLNLEYLAELEKGYRGIGCFSVFECDDLEE